MTEEDLNVLTFRVGRQMGSVACPTRHAGMFLAINEGDRVDWEVMRRGVRCCTTMRMMDLPLLDWLEEGVDVPVRAIHDLRNWK
jgi:hypothetical protein